MMSNLNMGVSAGKRIMLLLSVATLLISVIGGSLAYIVTQTPSLRNVFTSDLKPTGDLIIRKSVEHPFGTGYSVPEGLTFGFRVELGAEYAGKTLETSQGTVTADSAGVITVWVEADSSLTVYDLDVDTQVKVTEISEHPGFRANREQQQIVITKGQYNVVRFTNTYTAAPADSGTLRVGGVKNLEGRDWQEGDSFTFQLEYQTGFDGDRYTWEPLGTETVTYALVELEDPENPGLIPQADFNRFDFTALLAQFPFDEAGYYAFRVSEVAGSIGGISYDPLVGYFTVLVGDSDMDGSLEIQDVTVSGNAQVTVDETGFAVCVNVTNRYAPAGSAQILVDIVKNMEDRSGQVKLPEGFLFDLYDEAGNLVASSEATGAAGETAIKLVYSADRAGQTFFYTLVERADGQPGVVYDERTYSIQVSVADNLDGTVSAVVSAAGSEEAASDQFRAVFTNVYDPEDAALELSGTKELTGRPMDAGEFTFDLYQTGSDFKITEDMTPIGTATNSAEGGFTFDALTFDRVGTYWFVVLENADAALGGIAYDTSHYLVTVTVTDDGGSLTAKARINADSGEDAEILFRNTYTPQAASFFLRGRKVLNGAQLQADLFRFHLYEADAQFRPQGQPLDTASNDTEGVFTFQALRYDQAGTWYYLVTEDTAEPLEGVTYDDTAYGVTVTVADDGNGQLIAYLRIAKIGGGQADELLFVNTYEEKPTTVPTQPKPTDPSDPEDPKTGDGAFVILHWVLALASAAMLILLLRFGRRICWKEER